MRRSIGLFWLGAGLLASVTALGCRQMDCFDLPCPTAPGRPCSPCVVQRFNPCPCRYSCPCQPPPTSQVARSCPCVKQPVALRIETVAPPRPIVPQAIATRPGAPILPAYQRPSTTYLTYPRYSPYATSRTIPANPVWLPASALRLPQAMPPAVSTAARPLQSVVTGPEITPLRHAELSQPERMIPGLVGSSSYAHQSDYIWLVGVLERGPEVGTCMLRYGRPGDPDRYGGQLPLVAPQPIAGYRFGQLLRVEGHLVGDAIQTAYQVERIEVLSQH